jgi:hypothetical protein
MVKARHLVTATAISALAGLAACQNSPIGGGGASTVGGPGSQTPAATIGGTPSGTIGGPYSQVPGATVGGNKGGTVGGPGSQTPGATLGTP